MLRPITFLHQVFIPLQGFMIAEVMTQPDDRNNVSDLTVFARDIIKRKQTEAKRFENQAIFQAAMDQSQTRFAIADA